MKRVMCFIPPSLDEILFRFLLLHDNSEKYQYLMKKSMCFEKIARENRPEASCFTRRQNAPSYDITDKEARNWCKNCYVTCVLLDNLWNGFMKGKVMW